MNKETFLVKLREHLSILEDQEQEDILAEYEQHIDMKMQEGLSEEEAVQDFGAIQELATEILEAYHVKPEFRAKRPALRLPMRQGGSLEKEKGILKRGGAWLRNKSAAFGHGIANAFRWIFAKCHAFALWIARPFHRRKDRNTEEDGAFGLRQETNGTEEKILNGRNGVKGIRGMAGSFIRKTGRGMVALWKCFVALFVGCMWIAWNLAWLVFSLFCAFFALISLMGVGALFILLFQGYPLLGIFLIVLGGMLCFAALSFGALSLMKRKREKESNAGKWDKEVQYE